MSRGSVPLGGGGWCERGEGGSGGRPRRGVSDKGRGRPGGRGGGDGLGLRGEPGGLGPRRGQSRCLSPGVGERRGRFWPVGASGRARELRFSQRRREKERPGLRGMCAAWSRGMGTAACPGVGDTWPWHCRCRLLRCFPSP